MVAGGDQLAVRKMVELLDCGADVTVISPEICEDMQEIIIERKIKYRSASLSPEDIKGFFLIMVISDNQARNELVSEECNRLGILCNIVDIPPLCNFYAPSVISQGDLKIAISTNGRSPTLAKRIRQKLEPEFGKEYALFLRYLGKLRPLIYRRYPDDYSERKRIFEAIVDSPALSFLKKGNRKGFYNELKKWFGNLRQPVIAE